MVGRARDSGVKFSRQERRRPAQGSAGGPIRIEGNRSVRRPEIEVVTVRIDGFEYANVREVRRQKAEPETAEAVRCASTGIDGPLPGHRVPRHVTARPRPRREDCFETAAALQGLGPEVREYRPQRAVCLYPPEAEPIAACLRSHGSPCPCWHFRSNCRFRRGVEVKPLSHNPEPAYYVRRPDDSSACLPWSRFRVLQSREEPVPRSQDSAVPGCCSPVSRSERCPAVQHSPSPDQELFRRR